MTTQQPTREQVVQLIAELEAGSNWLSGKHGVYSYNRQPKIAAMFLKAFAEQWMPELLSELRAPHDWKLEGFGHYKDVTMAKSDAPFRAADAIESLARADLEATVKEQAAEIERLKAQRRDWLDTDKTAQALVDQERELIYLGQQLSDARLREHEAWNKAAECASGHSQTLEKLDAAQLLNEQLREALREAMDWNWLDDDCSNIPVKEELVGLLSTQPDISALEAERQRVAEACGKVCRNPDGRDVYGFATAVEAGQWKDHMK